MNQPPQQRSRISGATNEIILGQVEGQVRIGTSNRINRLKSHDTDNRASELPRHLEHSGHHRIEQKDQPPISTSEATRNHEPATTHLSLNEPETKKHNKQAAAQIHIQSNAIS